MKSFPTCQKYCKYQHFCCYQIWFIWSESHPLSPVMWPELCICDHCDQDTSPSQTKHTICQHQQETMRSQSTGESHSIWYQGKISTSTEKAHSFLSFNISIINSKLTYFCNHPPTILVSLNQVSGDHNWSSPHPITMLTLTSNIPDHSVHFHPLSHLLRTDIHNSIRCTYQSYYLYFTVGKTICTNSQSQSIKIYRIAQRLY